jgi:HD-like signal output (HDOD) protein
MSVPLTHYLHRVADLLPVPVVAQQVVQLCEEPLSTAQQLRAVIERDPAIVGRVLKVANSSLYGSARGVETLRDAIRLLGFRTISGIAVSASVESCFRRFGLAERMMWERSVVSAAVAVGVASLQGVTVSPERAYTVGLLHDFGRLVFSAFSPHAYDAVLARVYNEGADLVQSERAAFGFDHAALGSAVVGKWRLPHELEHAILHHHDPQAIWREDPSIAHLAAVAAVASATCDLLGVGRRAPEVDLELHRSPGWAVLGLTPFDVDPLIELGMRHHSGTRELLAG